jgi:hypothetical protein
MLADGTLSPELGRVELEGSLDGSESGFNEVSSSSSLSFSLGVNIVDTGELEELFGHGGSNQSGSSRSGNESNLYGSTLSGNFAGNGVGGTDFVSPISLLDGDDVELGHSDGSLDGALNFLVAFPSQSNVVSLITNNGESFESSSLTSLSLFLDGLDLHDLFLKVSSEESINNFLLLDGDRESEDVDDIVNKFSLNESAELGDWVPDNLVFLSVRSFSSLLISSLGETSLFSFGLSGSRCWYLGCLFSHKSQINIIGIKIIKN